MKNYKYLVFNGVFLFFLLNFFTNVVPIISGVLYYRFLLIIELMLVFLGTLIFKFKLTLRRNVVLVLISIVIAQLIAYSYNIIFENYICFDLHRLITFVLMYVISYEYSKKAYLKIKDFDKFNKGIIVVGVLACIYNTIINSNTILTFDLEKIMYSTYKYTSFFVTRSNFGLLLIISYSISLYKWEENKKISNILLALFFALNIFLTNARTSILTLFVITVTFFYLKRNKKCYMKILILLVCIVLFLFFKDIIFYKINNFIEKYYLLFNRNNMDVSNGRFKLWGLAFKNLNFLTLIIGHGIGSKDVYLSSVGSDILSFHSSWIDLFYEGGILLLYIYGFMLYFVYNYIKKSRLSSINKNLCNSYIITILVLGIGDAITLPFMLDTATIFSTIVCITIPITVSNGSLIDNLNKEGENINE